MHNEDIRRRVPTPAHEDEIMERSVLTQVLELALRVETDLRSCEQDAVERAVRELSPRWVALLRLPAPRAEPGGCAR